MTELPKVRYESFLEEKAPQVLHAGPFSEGRPTITKIHAFIKKYGFMLAGKHHEIYLSDIGLVSLEKGKTVIQQPMAQQEEKEGLLFFRPAVRSTTRQASQRKAEEAHRLRAFVPAVNLEAMESIRYFQFTIHPKRRSE